jgi:PEP-CTERM motif
MFTQPKRRLTQRSSLSLLFSFSCLLLLYSAQVARADEIAIWNFNDSDLIVDHGAGTLTTTFNMTNVVFAAGTATNTRQGDVAGQALSLQSGTGNANNGRNVTLNVSTVGFSAIVVSFATQGTSTGFNSNQFQYSLDGLTFVDFASPYTPGAAFGSVPFIFDLSGVTGLNDNPAAAFRIVFGGATSATGNNRIDNLVVEGANTTIPEPGSILMLGSGILGLLTLRRRKLVLTE